MESASVDASVFVLGGIHQHHEGASLYTYERVGEVYRHLGPDVLCVEALPQYAADGSFRKTPFDFTRAMIPAAREDGIPIIGIDWWDDERGAQWQALQGKAFADPALAPEVALFGGLFDLFGRYFQSRDFADLHTDELVRLWAAKSELKYAVLAAHPEYAPIVAYEAERNRMMADGIVKAVGKHPGARILVAVGYDHKPPLERLLAEHGIAALSIGDVLDAWWR